MRIGIAFAGGGLKGVAYIGVIQALRELDIDIDYISGTSSGSIFALMGALKYSKEEMIDLIKENVDDLVAIDKGPILKAGIKYLFSKKLEIGGLIPGEKIEQVVKKLIQNRNIKNMSDLDYNFAVATVDTISTKECIFLSNKIGIKSNNDVEYIYDAPIEKAIRASMSFPGIFTTCDYENYNFIDGGTKDNLPVKVLSDMGAEKTIGINFRIDDYEPSDNIGAILLRTVDIFSLKDVRKAQKIADISLEIDARNASLLTIDNIDELIKIGYNTIMENKEEILSVCKEIAC